MFALRTNAARALRAPGFASRALSTSAVLPQAQATSSNASEAPATKEKVIKKFSIYRWVRYPSCS